MEKAEVTRVGFKTNGCLAILLFVGIILLVVADRVTNSTNQRLCREAAQKTHREWHKFFDKPAIVSSLRYDRHKHLSHVSFVYKFKDEFVEKNIIFNEKPKFGYFEKVYLYVPDLDKIRFKKGFFSQNPDDYVLIFTEKEWKKIMSKYRSAMSDFRARRGPTHLWYFSPEKPPAFDDFVPINY